MAEAKPHPSTHAEFEALKARRPKMAPPYIPVDAALFQLKLDVYAFRVYCYLFGLVASKRLNWCRASKKALADRTGIGLTKVKAALKQLKDQGLIATWSEQRLNYAEFVVHEPWLSAEETSPTEAPDVVARNPRRGRVATTLYSRATKKGTADRGRVATTPYSRATNKLANARKKARACSQAHLPPSLSTIPQGTLDQWAERHGAARLLGVLAAAARIPGIKSPSGLVQTLLKDGAGLDESELLALMEHNLAQAAGAAELQSCTPGKELHELREALPLLAPFLAPGSPPKPFQEVWEAFHQVHPNLGLGWLVFWGQGQPSSPQASFSWLDVPEDVRKSCIGAPQERKDEVLAFYAARGKNGKH